MVALIQDMTKKANAQFLSQSKWSGSGDIT